VSLSFDVVVPTTGRPELGRALLSLAAAGRPLPGRLIVVDDRRDPRLPLAIPPTRLGVKVLQSGGAGPAAARNVGWRASRAGWVAFLDDDVLCQPGWVEALEADLVGLPDGVGGSQGNLHVPLPPGRRPTDWERNVKGLEVARWATADMAYRRAALAAVGGFDERFPRPYREDADLAMRVQAAGWRLVRGRRGVEHPIPPPRGWESLRRQAGNADDALMLRLHGLDWRRRACAGPGRKAQHLAITAAAVTAAAAALSGRRRPALLAGALWLGGTAEFAWRRIAPGPRTRPEVAEMLASSAAIPPLACWHWLGGLLGPRRRRQFSRPLAVLFDRDGTLVEDVPYNGDPALVRPRDGARAALDRLRRQSIPIAVVSNQSGVGRGLLSAAEVEAVNRRVEELLGPVGAWLVCPHSPEDGCDCRKPLPGLVLEAAARLGVPPEHCVLVGDIGADVEAALAAGARGILVPNAATRPEEVAAAPEVAPDLEAAVARLLR
jgi:histidinol-phosphate phosphatase family protein